MLPQSDSLAPVFEATAQATEEAMINAMVGAETMKGANPSRVVALPQYQLQEVLKKYNRFAPPR
jgi:L-aminopeptidase/D-esterase-like protein